MTEPTEPYTIHIMWKDDTQTTVVVEIRTQHGVHSRGEGQIVDGLLSVQMKELPVFDECFGNPRAVLDREGVVVGRYDSYRFPRVKQPFPKRSGP